MKRTSPAVLIVVLLLAAFTAAQVGAPVPYETPQFKVTLNAKPDTWSDPNTTHSSVDNFAESKAGHIDQLVTYRQITGGEIPVTTSSLDFYVAQQQKHGETLKSRQDGIRQGHIFTYAELTQADGHQRRFWLLIHDPHTVFVLVQLAPSTVNDDEEWNRFANSFEIKETSCWLPEGCDKK